MINKKTYNEYFQASRLMQTRLVTLLTAFLYVLYSVMDSYVLQGDMATYASVFHLYIIAPILVTISALTFRKDFYVWGIYVLMLSPILAGIGNFIIVSSVPNLTGYLVESYLIILWLFTLSGLSFFHASVSVFIILLGTVISSIFYTPLSSNELVIHSFWIICVSSFGLLIAFVLDRQNRIIYKSHQTLRDSAFIDELTKIYNRKKVDEFVPSEIERCKRFNHTFSFAILDIDYFKEVNDTYGHSTGDIVLKEVVQVMKNHIRSTDILIRWGGEEFILLCLETSLEDSLNLLERIKEGIENYDFTKVKSKTISIGVTTFEKSDTFNELFSRADKALYMAKDKGRNRIEVL